MKKLPLLLVCAVLCFAMLFSMTACDALDEIASVGKSDEELIIGKWEGTTTAEAIYGEQFELSFGEGIFNLENAKLKYKVEFFEAEDDREYKVFTINVEEADFDAFCNEVEAVLLEGYDNYVRDIIESNNYDVTVEGYYQQAGKTKEELVEENINSLKGNNPYEMREFEYGFNDDGKFFIHDDDYVMDLEISATKLKISGDAGKLNSFVEALMPMSLTKAK